jgi:hypothetical protein
LGELPEHPPGIVNRLSRATSSSERKRV